MAITKNAMQGITGTKKIFTFTFPYLKTKDLKVELFDSTTNKRTELDSTKFTFATATSISLSSFTNTDTDSNGELRTIWQNATGEPKSGITGNIYRETSSDTLVATFYPGSAIRSSDLNDNYTQNLYTTQESTNDADDALDNSRVLVAGVYKSAITIATEAETTAGEAETAADTAQLATDSLVATNSGTASAPIWVLQGDGTNNTANNKGVKYAVEQAEDAVDKATAADEIADDALANSRIATGGTPASPSGGYTSAIYLANQADTNATTALNNSRDTSNPPVSAITIATNASNDATAALNNSRESDGSGGYTSAISIANTASNNATTALNNSRDTSNPPVSAITIATNADTIADAAKLATDRLVATTSDGGNTWTLTGGNTNASTDPKGVKYAVDTADAASAAVSAAVLYTPKADKTALEAYEPTEDDYVEVASSLSITNGTWTTNSVDYTLSGMPATFTGAAGLTIRLAYTHSSNTYAWSSYFANDPEDRYAKTAIIDGGNFDTGGTLITTSITYDGGEFT